MTRLREDAAGSLGTNHLIYKVAAHFVETMEKPMKASSGVASSAWESGPIKEWREERFKTAEQKLLEWAGVDLTAKSM